MGDFTMDRVAERLGDLNDRWLQLNERWREVAGSDPGMLALVDEADHLRSEFANIACLGSPEAWRLLAVNNHFILPDVTGPQALAEHIVRENINIPELIRAIQNAVGGDDEQGKTGSGND